jgi:hypothetical protein
VAGKSRDCFDHETMILLILVDGEVGSEALDLRRPYVLGVELLCRDIRTAHCEPGAFSEGTGVLSLRGKTDHRSEEQTLLRDPRPEALR